MSLASLQKINYTKFMKTRNSEVGNSMLKAIAMA